MHIVQPAFVLLRVTSGCSESAIRFASEAVQATPYLTVAPEQFDSIRSGLRPATTALNDASNELLTSGKAR